MNNRLFKLKCFLVLSGFLLSGCAYLLTPSVETEILQLRKGQYQLDPSHTSVLFKVSHLNLSTYIGRFNQMDASLDFDPDKLTQTNLQATVSTSSVDVNNKSLEDSLRGDTWFDSERFPQATFKTISVEALEKANEFLFNAEMTLKGITKPIQFKATFHGGANNLLTGYYTIGFSATGSIKRSEFGIDEYIPMVGDNVDIEIYAEFQKL